MKALSLDDIKSSVAQVAKQYSVKSVSLFGSFAEGKQTTSSDIDLLVEFSKAISIYQLAALKLKLEELTGRNVDIIPAPLPTDTFLNITSEVAIYG